MGGPGRVWEQLFWLVFERSANPIWLLDEERRIVALNRAATALMGSGPDDLVGHYIDESIPPEDMPAARANWERFQRTGEGYTGTRALLRGDGSTVAVDFAAQLADFDGRRLAIYVSIPARAPDGGDGGEFAGEGLSEREREVVTLIAMGNETPDIARELHIAPATVRTHVRNAMGKLDVHTRAQLVAVALCGDEFMHWERLGREGA